MSSTRIVIELIFLCGSCCISCLKRSPSSVVESSHSTASSPRWPAKIPGAVPSSAEVLLGTRVTCRYSGKMECKYQKAVSGSRGPESTARFLSIGCLGSDTGHIPLVCFRPRPIMGSVKGSRGSVSGYLEGKSICHYHSVVVVSSTPMSSASWYLKSSGP